MGGVDRDYDALPWSHPLPPPRSQGGVPALTLSLGPAPLHQGAGAPLLFWRSLEQGVGAAGKSRLPQGEPGQDSSRRGTLEAQMEQKLQGTLTQPQGDR